MNNALHRYTQSEIVYHKVDHISKRLRRYLTPQVCLSDLFLFICLYVSIRRTRSIFILFFLLFFFIITLMYSRMWCDLNGSGKQNKKELFDLFTKICCLLFNLKMNTSLEIYDHTSFASGIVWCENRDLYLEVGDAAVVGANLMGVVFVCTNANVWPGKTGETCGFLSSAHICTSKQIFAWKRIQYIYITFKLKFSSQTFRFF